MQNTAKTTGNRESLFDDRFYRQLAAGCLKISIYVYWVLLYSILIGGTGYLLYKSKLSLPWIVTPALVTGYIIRKCKEHDPELREMFEKAKGKIGMKIGMFAVCILFYVLEIAIIWAVKSIFLNERASVAPGFVLVNVTKLTRHSRRTAAELTCVIVIM